MCLKYTVILGFNKRFTSSFGIIMFAILVLKLTTMKNTLKTSIKSPLKNLIIHSQTL